jgi:hypothetical protein
VKIMSDLVVAPELEATQMALVAPEPALRVARKLYDRLDFVAPEVATERMVVLAQCTVHICGDRARLDDSPELSRPHVPSDVFVENLIDMVAGALFAPVIARGSGLPS